MVSNQTHRDKRRKYIRSKDVVWHLSDCQNIKGQRVNIFHSTIKSISVD